MPAFVHVAAHGECAVLLVGARVVRWQAPFGSAMDGFLAAEMLAELRDHDIVSIGVGGLLAAANAAGQRLWQNASHVDIQMAHLAATGSEIELPPAPLWREDPVALMAHCEATARLAQRMFESAESRGVVMLSTPWYVRADCEPRATLPTVAEIIDSPMIAAWLWIEGYCTSMFQSTFSLDRRL
jgi:hypothetical protein